ncbi:hypothetical protein RUM44_011203 [Polyplax serrata]|uniref:Protein amnionless n=1 Tax=Polyplax serrata TaxID=468196 RepID=A0ABR1APP0_POLSC
MATFLLLLFLYVIPIDCLKTWVPNTGVNNSLNWLGGYVPRRCDNILFPLPSDVATYWNIRDLAISGLSLPKIGEIIFPNDIRLYFADKNKCSEVRDLKYTRSGVKGWLDPANWKTDDENSWVPHSERVPCTGEEINFASDNTVSVQLPSILLPFKRIHFGDQEFDGYDWQNFLKTDLGFQLFKGPDDLRKFPWKTDTECSNDKKCICARSAYTMRDGMIKEVNPKLFQEAVCLYAMPKCPPVRCFSPVKPEGHCCGICGAIIELEDDPDDCLNLSEIKSEVKAELNSHTFEKILKTYVGRTISGNIQIVVIAEDSSETINGHILTNAITRRFIEQKVSAKITSRISGLTFSKYLFNRVSGLIFGTLFAILILFGSIFYIYLVLPNKKLNLGGGKPFVFARFDNTLNDDGCDDHLEINIGAANRNELPQAFDNPIYSANLNFNAELNEFKENPGEQKKELVKSEPERSSDTQGYQNLTYNDLEKSEKLDVFNEGDGEKVDDEFSEIKL